MRPLLFAYLLLGMLHRPTPAAQLDARDEALFRATRAFYVMAAEWNGMSVDTFARRIVLVEAPSLAASGETCFRYRSRVDWAYVSYEDCFGGASYQRPTHFVFHHRLVPEQKLLVRSADEVMARLRERGATSEATLVERQMKADGRLLASPDLKVGEPGYRTLSLVTGEVDTVEEVARDLGADASHSGAPSR